MFKVVSAFSEFIVEKNAVVTISRRGKTKN